MAVRQNSPFGKANCKPSPRTASGLSAAYGWPPDREKRPITGTRPGRKTAALERRTPFPLLSKRSGDSHSLGVIAAKAVVDAVDLLEHVDEPGRGQLIQCEPASQVGKRSRDHGQEKRNQPESHDRANLAEWRPFEGTARWDRSSVVLKRAQGGENGDAAGR